MASDFQQRIQDHYEDPYHQGRCDYPTHAAELESACAASGKDVIAVELRVTDDFVSEIWFDGGGCKVSQAFASMLAEVLEGKRTDSVCSMSLETALDQLNLNEVDAAKLNCCKLVLDTVQLALNSESIDMEGGPIFGGPDLGDEC